MSGGEENKQSTRKRDFSSTSGQSNHQQQRQRKKNKPNNHWKSRNQQDAERKNKLDGDDGDDGDDGPRDQWNQRGAPHPGSYAVAEIVNSTDYQTRHISQANPVKKKFVLCISYLGTNYQGLQINPDAHTIEKELERALLYNGSLIAENFGYFSKIQYTRAARTDRGVHALTQSCAMRLIVPREVDNNDESARTAFLTQLNTFLPPDIQVNGIIKVSKNFNAHAKCTKRIYHYLLPTYLLQSKEFLLPILQNLYRQQGPIKGAGYDGGYVDPNSLKSLSTENLKTIYTTIENAYRISNEDISKFRSILKLFEGTRSYHNYTTGKDATEANAKRYMLSCTCEDPFINTTTGIEFIKIVFYGQSFLLNQIRKMVGMAIEVMHGSMSLDQMTYSFHANCKMDIPMIPALGLYLADIFFDGYNNKQRILTNKDQQIKEARENAGSEEKQEGEETKEGEENVNLQEVEKVGEEVEGGGGDEEEGEDKDEGKTGGPVDQTEVCMISFYMSLISNIYLDGERRDLLV